MKDLSAARRYAQALFRVAKENHVIDEVSRDLSRMSELVKSEKGLGYFLVSPKIKSQKKFELIDRVFKDRISEWVVRFIKILIRHRRMYLFDEAASLFTKFEADDRNIFIAKFESAVPLDSERTEDIRSRVSRVIRKEVLFKKSSVNPDLLGGFVVRFENQILDASLKNRLEGIRRCLLQADIN